MVLSDEITETLSYGTQWDVWGLACFEATIRNKQNECNARYMRSYNRRPEVRERHREYNRAWMRAHRNKKRGVASIAAAV